MSIFNKFVKICNTQCEKNDYENESKIIMMVILATSFSLIVLGYLFIRIYVKFFNMSDLQILHESLSVFYSESIEKGLYLFTLLCLPFLVIIFHRFFYNKIIIKKVPYNILHTVFVCTILGTVFFMYSSKNFYGMPDYFFVRQNFFFTHPFLYFLIFGFFLALILFLLFKKIELPKSIKTFFKILTIIIVIFIVILIFFWYLSKSNYDSGVHIKHFEAVIYSIAQVVNGKGLYIDFTNQYGLYPVFIAPIVRLLGFSTATITGIMAVLMAVSYFCIYEYLKNIIKAQSIVLVGFISFLFFYFIHSPSFKNTRDGFLLYLQYWPIRFLFPCILLGLGAFYFRRPKKYAYFILLSLTSLGVLWNSDTGIVAFGTLLLTLIYYEVLEYDFQLSILRNLKSIANKSFRQVFNCVITLGVVILFFYIYSFIKYGAFPSSNYLVYLEKFTMIGTPMPKYHPWIIYALMHIIGLCIASSCIFTKKNKYLSIILFMTSILGSGLFSFYVPMSDDHRYFAVRYTAILLGIIYFDLAFSAVKDSFLRHRVAVSEVIIFSALLFYFLSPVCNLFDMGLFREFVMEAGEAASVIKGEPSVYDEQANFIKSHTTPGEEIIILSHLQGSLYGYTGTSNPVKMPGLIEVINYNDYRNLIEPLKNGITKKLFLEPSYLSNYLLTEIEATVKLYYKPKDFIDGLVYLEYDKNRKENFTIGFYEVNEGKFVLMGDFAMIAQKNDCNYIKISGYNPIKSLNRLTITVNDIYSYDFEILPENGFECKIPLNNTTGYAYVSFLSKFRFPIYARTPGGMQLFMSFYIYSVEFE